MTLTRPGAEAVDWGLLARASTKDWESGSALEHALDLWRLSNGSVAAILLDPRAEDGAALATAGQAQGFPCDDDEVLSIGADLRLVYRGGRVAAQPGVEELLLATGVRLHQRSRQLKEQTFQENYRVVTLEALYDVGLAIGSTLNMDDLTDEVLLRAVSLLDARRGALYLLADDRYRLSRTIGGDAQDHLDADDPLVSTLLEATGLTAVSILPGATYPLAVPIEIEGQPKGLLVVADKESRTGVGPFLDGDRRALSLFANQAAIALENARLHRQALEKERLEREMELAAEIQRGILPASMPQTASVEIVGWNRPTRQVGGDYYGALSLGDGRLCCVVADVTGKGMPAALLVSTLHSALKLLFDKVGPGEDLLVRLNQHILESSSSNKFITLILVEVEDQGSRLGYINAGHNPGLVVRRSGEVVQLPPSGLPLGLMSGSTYRYDGERLEPGDLVCLYSDGITECESATEEEFGLDRLTDFLVERRKLPLEELIRQLDEAVVAFADGRPQGDDQTVVLLRRIAR